MTESNVIEFVPKKIYLVGWNTPGYLPETEPYECDTLDDAKEALVTALEEQEDFYYDVDETLALDFGHTIGEVRRWSTPETTDVMPDGYVYWIVDASLAV